MVSTGIDRLIFLMNSQTHQGVWSLYMWSCRGLLLQFLSSLTRRGHPMNSLLARYHRLTNINQGFPTHRFNVIVLCVDTTGLNLVRQIRSRTFYHCLPTCPGIIGNIIKQWDIFKIFLSLQLLAFFLNMPHRT